MHIIIVHTNTFVALFSSFSVASQRGAVPVCHHSGCDVVLHGRQEVQDSIFGSSSVTGGETNTGGAEHSAGILPMPTCTFSLVSEHIFLFLAKQIHKCTSTQIEGWDATHWLITGCFAQLRTNRLLERRLFSPAQPPSGTWHNKVPLALCQPTDMRTCFPMKHFKKELCFYTFYYMLACLLLLHFNQTSSCIQVTILL